MSPFVEFEIIPVKVFRLLPKVIYLIVVCNVFFLSYILRGLLNIL